MSNFRIQMPPEGFLFVSCLAVVALIIGRLRTVEPEFRPRPVEPRQVDRSMAWCSRLWDKEASALAETVLERLERKPNDGNAETTLANLMVRATEKAMRGTFTASRYSEVLTAAADKLWRAAQQHHHGAHYSLALLLKLYPSLITDNAQAASKHLCLSQKVTANSMGYTLIYDWPRVIEDATIQGLDAVITSKKKIYVRSCYPALFRQFRAARTVKYDAVALVDGFSATSYYHWLLEGLPRLLELSLPEPMPVFLPDAPFVEDTLQLLPRSLFHGFSGMHFRSHDLKIHAKRLYVPHTFNKSIDLGSPAALSPTRAAVDSIREYFPEASNLTSLLLVVRKQDEARSFGNQAAVTAALATVAVDHNLTLIVFDHTFTMAATVAAFKSARLVVGVHGAGLANLVFCSQRAAVLELALPEPEFAEYATLASLIGLRYAALPLPAAHFEARAWPRPNTLALAAHSLLS